MVLITWTNAQAPFQWLSVLSHVNSEIVEYEAKKNIKPAAHMHLEVKISQSLQIQKQSIMTKHFALVWFPHQAEIICQKIISSLQSSAPNDASWCQLITREQQWGLVFWWHEAGWERKQEEEPQHHRPDCRHCCLDKAKLFSTFVCTCRFVTFNSNNFHAFLFVPTFFLFFFFLQTWHLLPKATLMHWSEWVNWPVRVKDPKI